MRRTTGALLLALLLLPAGLPSLGCGRYGPPVRPVEPPEFQPTIPGLPEGATLPDPNAPAGDEPEAIDEAVPGDFDEDQGGDDS